MMRPIAVIWLLLALAGCNVTDPYARAGAWRPNGANDVNLRAMVLLPSDLVLATPADRSDGGLAAAAAARLREDKVRPLPDSGLAQIVPVASGSAPAPPPATAAPAGNGSGGNGSGGNGQ